MRTIKIDGTKREGKQDAFWCSTGFTPARLLLQPDMQQMLEYLGSLPYGGIRYARIHFLLDLVKAEGLDTPHPRYDWSELDEGLDVLAANGMQPFFELMGNPSGFFNDFLNDGQLHAWRRLVRDLALHLMERYGRENVEQWYFETWNEPDIGWWHQWPQEQPFCNYYDACSEGLKEASPRIRFGGPGTCKTLSPLFKALMAHCETGRNYFTGETGVRLDFISVHEKGAWSSTEDIAPNTRDIVDKEVSAMDYVREHHPRLAGLPWTNNECDPIVGWRDIHTWHARPYYAALICKVLRQHQKAIIEDRNCPYPLLSNDNGFVGAWGMRTLMAKLGRKEHVERNAFELVKKPALNAMAMLSLLGPDRLAADGCGDPLEDDIGVIATRAGKDAVAVLLYHSTDRTTLSGNETVDLRIKGLPFEEGMLVHYRIDDRHGDPFLVWEAEGFKGAPGSDALEKIRARQELEMLAPPQPVKTRTGTLRRRFDLPLPSVSLVLVLRKPATAPKTPSGLRARACATYTDRENILLRWTPLASRNVKTYEVLFSESERGPFKRINPSDLVCGAFLHARKTASGRGFYKVRAVDYWDRAGRASAAIER